MYKRVSLRAGALLVLAGAVLSGITFAAVRPITGGARASAQLSAASTGGNLTYAQIQQDVLKVLKTKVATKQLSQTFLGALTAVQYQAKIDAELRKQIETSSLRTTLSNVVASQGFVHQGQELQTQVLSQLKSSPALSQLTKSLDLAGYLKASATAANSNELGGVPSSDYLQGPGPTKVVTGQGASTDGNPVTVVNIPTLMHVSGLWWPSDGTAQFTLVNDSSNRLEYGGDFTGIPYGDNFSGANFGSVGPTDLSPADGSLAPHASVSFQITPQPAQSCDTPSQTVPYRGEAHIQVTAPGADLVTIDLSAFVKDPACASGSALLSGMAMVAPT